MNSVGSNPRGSSCKTEMYYAVQWLKYYYHTPHYFLPAITMTSNPAATSVRGCMLVGLLLIHGWAARHWRFYHAAQMLLHQKYKQTPTFIRLPET
jgi:hypothetical protein